MQDESLIVTEEMLEAGMSVLAANTDFPTNHLRSLAAQTFEAMMRVSPVAYLPTPPDTNHRATVTLAGDDQIFPSTQSR